MHDILETVRRGKVKPTHILYKSNLSSQMMGTYLKELIEKSFLVEQRLSKGRTYALAPRGFQFLEKYSLITEFTNSFGLDHN